MLNTIPDNEFKERVERVQEKMAEEKLDILITFGDEAEPQYVRYFSDYWPSFETAGVFIPLEGDPVLLMSMVRGVVLEPILMHRAGRLKRRPDEVAGEVAAACGRILGGGRA